MNVMQMLDSFHNNERASCGQAQAQEEQLQSTQEELIALKKAQSLVGLDQKQLIDK